MGTGYTKLAQDVRVAFQAIPVDKQMSIWLISKAVASNIAPQWQMVCGLQAIQWCHRINLQRRLIRSDGVGLQVRGTDTMPNTLPGNYPSF